MSYKISWNTEIHYYTFTTFTHVYSLPPQSSIQVFKPTVKKSKILFTYDCDVYKVNLMKKKSYSFYKFSI